MTIRVSAITNGVPKFLNKSKKSRVVQSQLPSVMQTNAGCVLLSAGTLASALKASTFLQKTDDKQYNMSGYYETTPPADSSDYPQTTWTNDSVPQTLPTSSGN